MPAAAADAASEAARAAAAAEAANCSAGSADEEEGVGFSLFLSPSSGRPAGAAPDRARAHKAASGVGRVVEAGANESARWRARRALPATACVFCLSERRKKGRV